MYGKGLYLLPKSEEIEKIIERLMRYPVVKLHNKRIAVDLGRYRCIRRLKEQGNFVIKDGYVFIPEHVCFVKKGKRYYVKFKGFEPFSP